MVMRMRCDKPGMLNIIAKSTSILKNTIEVAKRALLLKGRAPSQVDPSYYDANREPVVYGDSADCKGHLSNPLKLVASER